MKIAEVKKLDNGVKDIIIEGKVIKLLKDPKENEYGWSQFVKIQDDTDKLACWVNIETEEDAYKVGQYVKMKGKVNKYTKGNKPQVSFGGNVIDEIVKVEDVSQEQPIDNTQPNTQPMEKPKVNVTTTVNNKDMDKVWEDKDLRMARESALKNIAQYVVAGLVKLGDRFDYADEDVDFIYNGLGKNKPITSEAITEEFGGTQTEEKPDEIKEQKIAQARELVKNPHLAEPVDDTMATVKQKQQIYGYIDKEGKKIGGIVDSQYITEEEVKGVGDWQKLTKSRAIAMWEAWYGKEEELGERDKRELEAKQKEAKENPFITKSQPLEKREPGGNSLTKDVLIDDIQAKRKELHLEDDAKFTKEIGYNTNFEKWTEKELTKLKDLLKDWRPDWVEGK